MVAAARPMIRATAGFEVQAPTLPGMDAVDELVADLWATAPSPDTHPIEFIREQTPPTRRPARRGALQRAGQSPGTGRRHPHPPATTRHREKVRAEIAERGITEGGWKPD
jgi:hypothetical protein